MPSSSALVQAIGWAPGRPLSWCYVGVTGLFAKTSVQGCAKMSKNQSSKFCIFSIRLNFVHVKTA